MTNIVRQPARNTGWSFFNDDLDNIFEGFFRPVQVNSNGSDSGASLVPAIDMHENENSYTVLAEIPGVKKEDIDVTVHDGVLRIDAETRYEHEDSEEGRVIRQERRVGKYSRAIRLGKDVDASKVEASYNDGVLELKLPKLEEVKPRKISVNVN